VNILNPVSIQITYTLTVTNNGATTLGNVQVTDNLATAFVTSLGYTLVDVTTSSGLTENPAYNGDSDINLLTGSDTLIAGQTETITLIVNVTTGGTAQTYTNVGVASGEPPFGPPVTDTGIASGPEFTDPAVTKAADVSLASVGDLVTFTITVTNNGNQTATGVRVIDPLPSNMDYVSATSVPRGAISLVLPRTVVVDLGDVAPGDVITIRVVARINSEGNPPIENRVTLATTSSTNLVSNDIANVSLTVTRLLLPATGFAPNKITRLPLQPQNKIYAAYNDLGLHIPALKVTLPVVGIPKTAEGWDVTWLGQQAGWLNGTAFPTWSGNSVVTGHVYLSNGLPGPFVNLGKLKYGDQVIVNAFGQRYIYEVRSVLYLKPDDTTSTLRHEDKAWITLLTCKDYDPVSNTYRSRVAVRAVLIKVEPGK
jgi:LPXTG-site transpeptidase (sortase) family protein